MQPSSPNDRVSDALQRFMAAPPEGTPPEVVEALCGPAIKNASEMLPPKLFVRAVEELTVAISITDTNAKILYVNPACQRLSGYVASELLGKNQSVFSDKSTPRDVYKTLWNTITKGKPWTGMLVNRKKDGSRYLADLTIIPVPGSNGEIAYYLGMHRDVTDVHNLQKLLVNQKALLETVVDAAPVAVALITAEGKVILDNLTYKSLMADLGHEPAAVILDTWCASKEMTLLEASKRCIDVDHFEMPLEMGAGRQKRWFSCSGSWASELSPGAETYFEESDRQSGLLLVINEVTKQHRQREADRNNAMRALLAEQSTVQNMREVLEGAIFKLQGPLNVISAAVKMVERQEGPNGPLAPVLTQALQTGWETIDHLRSAVPSSPNEAVQPANVNEALRDVLEISTDQFLKSSVMVDWKPTTLLPQVLARPTALRSLIKNMLDNALIALDEPGAVGRDVFITTNLTESGEVELAIRDTGGGISPGWRHKAFEPFASGWKRRQGATGMGLAIAQQIMVEQGGTLDIEPAPNGGCNVRAIFLTSMETSRERNLG